MNEPRLQISEGMRRFLDYRKFAGPTRMLILEAKYFFEDSWRRAGESLGWEVAGTASAMIGSLSREDITRLFQVVGEFQPDFMLGSNYAGMDANGLFARFFEDARIPYVSWFTDTPRMILHQRAVHPSYYAVAATWERAYVPHFEALGFEHVYFMPLATDPAVFRGDPTEQCHRAVAFVGDSMIKHAEEAWEKLEHLPEVTDAMRQAFDEGRVTRENFAEGIGAILEDGFLEGRTASELRHIELCFVYEATRRQREALARLPEPLAVEVWGDEYWTQVTKKAFGKIGYFDDLPGFYRHTAVNLNSTSLQMRSAVNQRVFDCPAAGGFLLTDAQSDLDELFDPDTEVAAYASLDELADKTRFYLGHPDQAAAVVRRAQRRIEAHHTHARRLEALEAYLKQRYA